MRRKFSFGKSTNYLNDQVLQQVLMTISKSVSIDYNNLIEDKNRIQFIRKYVKTHRTEIENAIALGAQLSLEPLISSLKSKETKLSLSSTEDLSPESSSKVKIITSAETRRLKGRAPLPPSTITSASTRQDLSRDARRQLPESSSKVKIITSTETRRLKSRAPLPPSKRQELPLDKSDKSQKVNQSTSTVSATEKVSVTILD